jgi:uncharacterized delta-60 repeat protein
MDRSSFAHSRQQRSLRRFLLLAAWLTWSVVVWPQGWLWAAGVALQSDGKVVRIGRVDHSFAVVRYNPDGSLDPSFGQEGKVITHIGTDTEIEDEARDLALQADGKIVVIVRAYIGFSKDSVLVRYNPDGSLDPNFGTDGKVPSDSPTPRTTHDLRFSHKDTLAAGALAVPIPSKRPQLGVNDAFALAIQADGRLVVGGSSLARYQPDGSLDSSFGTDGKVFLLGVVDTLYALALQADGKIVAAGKASYNQGRNSAFAVVRYNSDGSLDASFGTGGTVITRIGRMDAAGDVAIQTDSKLVVVGKSFNGRSIDFVMVRYNPDGSVDASFGTGGQTTSDFCAHKFQEESADSIWLGSIGGGWSIGLQANGKIVATGVPSSVLCHGFVLLRYNADGSPDVTFGKAGRVTTPIVKDDGYSSALVLQEDGKIVVVGSSIGGLAMVRYNPDGSLDPTFGTQGKVTTQVSTDNTMAVEE